jgi:hypothetical protein
VAKKEEETNEGHDNNSEDHRELGKGAHFPIRHLHYHLRPPYARRWLCRRSDLSLFLCEENLPLPLASKLDCLGAFLFALIAILGFVFGGVFFVNFLVERYGQPLELLSAGTIPLSNIAIGLKVGASLFLVILALSIFRPERSARQ